MKSFIRFIVFVLCFMTASGTALADYEKIKIAVLPFHLQGENFETEDMGRIVAEWLITAFVKEGRFDVIERMQLGQILEEQQMVEAGLVSPETAAAAETTEWPHGVRVHLELEDEAPGEAYRTAIFLPLADSVSGNAVR